MDRQEYVVNIIANLKKQRICHYVALIIFLINIILNLWNIVISIASNIDMFAWIEKYWSDARTQIALVLMIVLTISNCISKKKCVFNEERGVKGIMSSHLSSFIFVWFLLSIWLLCLFFNQMGYVAIIFRYCGTVLIPIIIGHVFLVIACVDAKKYNNFAEKENREKREQELLAQKLLAKTGKIFFVIYYYQLKKYNFIDVFDVIRENYSEENKKCRIAEAKKIFDLNLQLIALKVILKNEDGVANQEVLDIAQLILETENAEQLALAENKRKEIEEKNKKVKIIPDCSLCRYNIDENHCDIWIKKPDKACEDFKIKKQKSKWCKF